jgi:hypothetical protein
MIVNATVLSMMYTSSYSSLYLIFPKSITSYQHLECKDLDVASILSHIFVHELDEEWQEAIMVKLHEQRRSFREFVCLHHVMRVRE